MKFNSTNGQVTGVTFKEAVFTGFAADGGLLMPETIPRLSASEIEALRTMPYVDVVKEICAKFISPEEIPREDLNGLIDEAFSVFPPGEKKVPLHYLRDDLAVLELFHGPSLSFKDYGMFCLAQFIKYFLKRDRQRAVCIVATSGDTGSAALEAFKNQDLIDVIVLLPKDLCSPIQELQMTTVCAQNSHVIRGEGTSDDLDVPLKAVLLNKELSKEVRLFSVNSINFGRILIQAAHHTYAYLRASSRGSDNVQVAIPSGALGNITSGCMARAMGIPVEFILCTNSNDIAHQMLLTGCLSVKDEVLQTHSYAMNIQKPYNVARLLWIFSDADKVKVPKLASEYEENNYLSIPNEIMEKMRAAIVASASVDDATVRATMARCWRDHAYLVCPHTACGLAPCLDRAGPGARVVVATASPAKFPEVATCAEVPADGALLDRLRALPAHHEDWARGADWTALLESTVRRVIAR